MQGKLYRWRITHPTRTDRWIYGDSKIIFGRNGRRMMIKVADFIEQKQWCYEKEVSHIKVEDSGALPGWIIHEMGGVRHGKRSKNVLLNGWNHLHHCRRLCYGRCHAWRSTSTQILLDLYGDHGRAANYCRLRSCRSRIGIGKLKWNDENLKFWHKERGRIGN